MSKKGILLINLGSPDSPSVPDVRRYLREFLMDERVLDVVLQGHAEMWAAMRERDAIYANPDADEKAFMRAARKRPTGMLFACASEPSAPLTPRPLTMMS